MKNLFFAVIVTGLAQITEAREGFFCIPSMKSTWIYVEKKTDQFVVTVKNPMGYQYMGQFDGPVAPSSLPFQKMQYNDLNELSDEFSLSWPASSCEFNGDQKTLFCNGSAQKKIKAIQSNGISTIKVIEKYKTESYEKSRYRINFEKEGNTYFVSLDFFNSTCENLK
jgi:hypothetical protein